MITKEKSITILTPAFLFEFLSGFIACSSSLFTYQGKPADQKSRIVLKSFPIAANSRVDPSP